VKIEVRNESGSVVETIERKPFTKGWLGNFIPVYVRYKCKIYSLKGGWDYAYMHGEPSEAYITI